MLKTGGHRICCTFATESAPARPLALFTSAAGDPEARNALRALVETVTVHAGDTRRGGFMIEIAGRMAALLGEDTFPNRLRRWGHAQSGITMVAEERLELPTRGL